ncbi:hypothetical protein CHF27_004295 [Romboutsia maritimum]|uniref:Serine aminopeptidase S33 domain-containing protein n=1 Tax=Romboutsia maritimum TaxID=2020948 RepID=A0A371IUZ3_9FIRM|nr:prolyl oligopeptidase family serine peptidase [Romboutsia maritimum]RDY24310.1 hypothetical protein CHF27_004295 [Romboutsia maritimum]
MRKFIIFLLSGVLMSVSLGCSSTVANVNEQERKEEVSNFDKKIIIKTDGYEMPAILTMPGNDKDYPVVVLVHGSGPNDMDCTIGSLKPFKDIAQGLKEKGIATLRYDKRTFAQKEKVMKEVDKLTLKEETVDDAISAINLLKNTENIDKNRIYVIGHSQGAMAIPMINNLDKNSAGFVMMAPPARKMEDILLEQTKYILDNTDKIDEKEKNNQIKEVKEQVNKIKEFYKTGKSDSNEILGLPINYWKALNDYDQIKEGKNINKPTLILQGERDYQVTTEDYNILKEALKNKKNITMKSYKNLNHVFMKGEGKATPQEYSKEGNVSKEVIDDIASWIQEN